MDTIKRHRFYMMVLCVVLLSVAAPVVGWQQFPESRGAINDFAEVLSPAAERSMEQIAIELLQKTGAVVVVVTMQTIGDEEYTDYANRLYAAWGIGQKGDDRGVLILDVIDIRKIRIEVGYGLEGIIPDGLAGEIRDRYMVPHLRNDDFDTGLGQGFAAIVGLIANDAGVSLTGLSAPTQPSRRGRLQRTGVGSLVPLIMIILFMVMSRGRRRGGLLPALLLGGMMGGMMGGMGRGFGGGGFGGGGGGIQWGIWRGTQRRRRRRRRLLTPPVVSELASNATGELASITL